MLDQIRTDNKSAAPNHESGFPHLAERNSGTLPDLADAKKTEAEIAWFLRVIESEISPLLDEYCFDDPERADEWCQNLRS